MQGLLEAFPVYLTNITRLGMGSGYSQPLLPSAAPTEVVQERLQWLIDNGHASPRCLGAPRELEGWSPTGAAPAGLGWEDLARKVGASLPQEAAEEPEG